MSNKQQETPAPGESIAPIPSSNKEDGAKTEGGGEQQQQQVGGKKKKEKKTPPNIVIPPKKPKLSKAERRALQEAQRAAKGQKADGGGKKKGGKEAKANAGKPGNASGDGNGKQEKRTESEAKEAYGYSNNQDATEKNVNYNGNEKTLNFFSHLPPYKDHNTMKHEFSGVVLGSGTNNTNVLSSTMKPQGGCTNNSQNLHPAVLSLGLQYTTGKIRGANARAKAMMYTFKRAIQDYALPSSLSASKDKRSSLVHDLLKPTFNYFSNTCRTHSVTMGNAFTFLKKFVMDLNRDIDILTLKDSCCDAIDRYIQERIMFADKVICENACTKIVDGDVILTYAKSEVIQALLVHAHTSEEKDFRVIVVDSRPLLEGRKALEILTQAGIECTYIFLNSVSYVMKEVTKAFMGAAALMSDGSILSRVGTASVALMARSNNVPVLFCCETYKITSRVQLESITGNELGNPDDLISTNCAIDKTLTRSTSHAFGANDGSEVLSEWRASNSLKLLNLLYDLTPSEFVSGIVTEMGILPPTSVAVLLREMNPQDHDTAFKAEI